MYPVHVAKVRRRGTTKRYVAGSPRRPCVDPDSGTQGPRTPLERRTPTGVPGRESQNKPRHRSLRRARTRPPWWTRLPTGHWRVPRRRRPLLDGTRVPTPQVPCPYHPTTTTFRRTGSPLTRSAYPVVSGTHNEVLVRQTLWSLLRTTDQVTKQLVTVPSLTTRPEPPLCQNLYSGRDTRVRDTGEEVTGVQGPHTLLHLHSSPPRTVPTLGGWRPRV